MTDRDDARRMLYAAAADLKALHNMLVAEQFEDSIFGFHAQQTAEKSLKAWLSLRGRAYPKTHDLRVLFQLIDALGEDGWEAYEDLADLTDFAVQFRYDTFDHIENLDRQELLADVRSLFEHVDRLVKDKGEGEAEEESRAR